MVGRAFTSGYGVGIVLLLTNHMPFLPVCKIVSATIAAKKEFILSKFITGTKLKYDRFIFPSVFAVVVVVFIFLVVFVNKYVEMVSFQLDHHKNWSKLKSSIRDSSTFLILRVYLTASKTFWTCVLWSLRRLSIKIWLFTLFKKTPFTLYGIHFWFSTHWIVHYTDEHTLLLINSENWDFFTLFTK